MKCLETRRRDGVTHRRYRDADGVIHHTVEIPRAVWTAMGKRAEARLRKHEHGLQLLRRRLRGLQLLDAGWKPVAIAHELGVTTNCVERWRRKAKD